MDWTRGHTIGHGSSATVSLAASSQSGKIFAVKSTELSQSEFLQREQSILSSLASSHVIGYMGCDVTEEDNKVMYNILLEYMPGGSISHSIRVRGGRLDESLIRFYTKQVVHGLMYLHFNGLVHCDIKSSNILVGESGGVKIADFGCARRVMGDKTVPFGGTPLFMSPEVARGEEQGFASDIWGLGCTVIEMAGGSLWPNVNDPVSAVYQIAYSGQVPEFPCGLSEQGKDFLDKCLKRNPRERWTATQLLNHPFLQIQESNSHGKQIQESNSRNSNSPISILDHGFWNSVDDHDGTQSVCNSSVDDDDGDDERMIRRLSLLFSAGPRWDWDENWVTVRDQNWCCSGSILDKIEAKDEILMIDYSCQVSGDEVLSSGVLDSKISSSRFSGEYCRDDRVCAETSFVNSHLRLDKDQDLFSPPLVSRLIIQS